METRALTSPHSMQAKRDNSFDMLIWEVFETKVHAVKICIGQSRTYRDFEGALIARGLFLEQYEVLFELKIRNHISVAESQAPERENKIRMEVTQSANREIFLREDFVRYVIDSEARSFAFLGILKVTDGWIQQIRKQRHVLQSLKSGPCNWSAYKKSYNERILGLCLTDPFAKQEGHHSSFL